MRGLNVEHRASGSVHVERVWWSGCSQSTHMLSIANSNWELVIEQGGERSRVHIRGPETRPSMVTMPEHAQAIGIVFAHGTAMPQLPMPQLVDSSVIIGDAPTGYVPLGPDFRELRTHEDAEVFVAHLARAGILTRDDVVADAAAGHQIHGLSRRTVQRRVASATGLSRDSIRQIERARAAAQRLRKGSSTVDTVHGLGYYDQSHLTRSLRKFIGRTATQLQHPEPHVPVSPLYKTPHMGPPLTSRVTPTAHALKPTTQVW